MADSSQKDELRPVRELIQAVSLDSTRLRRWKTEVTKLAKHYELEPEEIEEIYDRLLQVQL